MQNDSARRQQNFEAITFSYLKRHYFDAAALKARTIDEFVRAVRTGRLIAFTGSMTTEDRGYAKWGDFVKGCFKAAAVHFDTHGRIAGDRVTALRNVVEMFQKYGEIRPLDNRVSFSVIGETVDLAASYSGQRHINPNHRISDEFFLHRPTKGARDHTILEALLHDLNIDRTITLNYDLEVELEYSHRPPPKARRRSENALDVLGDLDPDERTGALVKRLPGARSMVSDIFNRERTDRLFEFAIGSADHEYHVLHLHGRADAFDSMVVSYRDYDRLYRRTGLSKAPFEHALRMLFAGNPILFVGIGMTEADVVKTLQDFVGNHPYRRIVPTFMLWNSVRDDDGNVDQAACDVFRIDMLHRLGVLTIFSHDLEGPDRKTLAPELLKKSEGRYEQLRLSIVNLASELNALRDRRLQPIVAWRSMRERAQAKSGLIAAWKLDAPVSGEVSSDIDLNAIDGRLTLIATRSGAGKGSEARRLADRWLAYRPDGTALLLNADFCFDTDSLLNLIGDFLKYRNLTGRLDEASLAKLSRNEVFHVGGAFTHAFDRPAIIIFSGVERLFGTNGEPLSAEFDDMLRAFSAAMSTSKTLERANTGIVIFATPRTRSYFTGLMGPVGKGPTSKLIVIDKEPKSSVYSQSRYLDHLQALLGNAARPIPRMIVSAKENPAQELAAYRRAFYAAFLEPRQLEKAGVGKQRGRLAIDILTVMAHIGQPVEADVLFHAPRIQRRLRQRHADKPASMRTAFLNVMARLEAMQLVLALVPFPDSTVPMRRFGLHATMLSELRERSGVPLSEAVLSTAFNMSLYAAQPTDGPLPEPFLHDELGHLIDWMIGAYKDEPLHPSHMEPFRAIPSARPDAIAALRAALAIIRGYYSTTALLSLDGKDRAVGTERDGALTEHAERLERLLGAFRRCVDELQQAGAQFADRLAGPFYPDEIVWLYNEIGVVKLAQGSLYEARFALDEAERYNRDYVEFDSRSHNWRRIMLNQIVVDIERARLDTACDRIRKVEDRIDGAKRDAIAKVMAEGVQIPIPTIPEVSHEEILSLGLAKGYRGICAHIAGELVDAKEHFDAAIEMLRRLDERRAYAVFQRHRAALVRDLASKDADRDLDLAISAAESVRQMDLVHHCRIDRAARSLSVRDIDAWTKASRQLQEALVYADTTDMYRVRVEARANLAVASMATGDFEVALEHVTDALTVATRHGLSLRKASLRILLGRILMRRGDPESGRALIESGKAAASRVGFQRAVSRAQAALMIEGGAT